MTTLAELVAATPAADRGIATQAVYNTGTWRWVVELADPAAGASVAWYDITTLVAGVAVTRGADQYGGRYRASVAYLDLYADDDDLAPWNPDTSATFGTHVDLGAGLIIRGSMIRVRAGATVEWWPRFTNRVEAWTDAAYAGGQVRRHTVTTRDLITQLVNVPVGADTGANWWDRVAHVLTEAGWDFDDDLYGAELDSGAADVLTLGASSENANALNELQATLDPAGVVYRTDRTGKLIMHPAPWDTWHAGIFTAGGTGAEYTEPATVIFSNNAIDDGHAAYATGSDLTEPFGLDDSELSLVNHWVNNATTTYDVEDSTSIARYGRRTRTVAWQVDSDDVVDDQLAHFKVAHREARPLVTSIDQPGFMAAIGVLDHLTPVTIKHQTAPGRDVVEADGYVRTIVENITPRSTAGISWDATVTVDIDTDSTTAELNPPESLSAGTPGETDVTLTWTNPSQTITPTETQIRLSPSSIWAPLAYPITTIGYAGLVPSTVYTAEVRYVKRVDTIITNQSSAAEVTFTTATPTVPTVRPGPSGGVTVTAPCDTPDWRLQRSDDGTTWTTIDSGTGTTNTLVFTAASFDSGYIYRVQTDCGSGWVTSIEFVAACTTPVALSSYPFAYPTLTMYVPGVCPPNRIMEAVTGTEGWRGPEFAGIFARYDANDDPAIIADDAGIVAYGYAPNTVGQIGDQTLSATVYSATLEEVDNVARLGQFALSIVDVASSFYAKARISLDGDLLTVTGTTALSVSTEYTITASYTQSTGVLELLLDDVSEGTDTATSTGLAVIEPLGYWIASAPSDGWVTEIGAWNTADVPTSPPDTNVVESDFKTRVSSRTQAVGPFTAQPAEGDTIVAFVKSVSSTDTLSGVPAGWTNELGGTTMVSSDSNSLGLITHVVTAAEETASTKSWTLTNLMSEFSNGGCYALIVSNVADVDVVATGFDNTGTPPHALPAVTPTVTGMIVAAIAKDTTTGGPYDTPTGWTEQLADGANGEGAVFTYDTWASPATTVGPVDVTGSDTDEYAAISAVLESA